jgi:putative transcriptional regulator
MATHHLPEHALVEYVAGTTPEALSLAVACHLSLCGLCRTRADQMESVGGALLEQAPSADLSAGLLDRVLAQLDQPAPPAPTTVARPELAGLPRALWTYLPDGLAWKFVVPGIRACDLRTEGGWRARVVRLQPGLEIPLHDHEGDEYTVIFAGGIDEQDAHFRRGDVCVREPGHQHTQRIAAGEPCIALLVNAGPFVPLTLKGKLVKWLARE